MTTTIYHNPHCSKSREALRLVQEKDTDVTVIEYLKTPPSIHALRNIILMLDIPAVKLIRTKEAQELGIVLDQDEEALIQEMHKHPQIIERPIVIKDGKAKLGRPPEDVLQLYNEDKTKMANTIIEFQTNRGNFKVELFTEQSPVTAGNFKQLVEKEFFNGTRFHRVIKNFMIQGGDPYSKKLEKMNDWGMGGPGYSIKDEFIKGLSNKRGTLSMANSGPNSGGSQFFINVVDNTYLDWDKPPQQSKHPVFGKVIEGMDVVDKIANVRTKMYVDRPVDDVIVEKVSVVE